MLMFLHGEDSYRMQERVDVLKNGFQNKYDTSGTNSNVLYGDSASASDIRSSILSVGLFATKRFTVVRQVFDLKEPAQQALLECIEKMDEDSIIVCTTNKLPGKKKGNKKAQGKKTNETGKELAKKLLAAERVEEFKPLTEYEIASWLTKHATANGVTLSRPVITFMQQALGDDLWAMHHVIVQLAHYNTTPDEATIQTFVNSPVDDNIFHLTDALSDKNTKLALQLLDDQFTAGANLFYLISMLARQIGVLIEVKETNGEGSSLHPYVIKKALRSAQRFDLEQLYHFHNDLVELDYGLKSTALDARVQLDTLLVKWTS